MKYRVFRLGEDRILRYSSSSNSPGYSRWELGFMVEGSRVDPGDVIEIDGEFILIEDVELPDNTREPHIVRYQFLPFHEDGNYPFGDGVWSPQMIARLRREAQETEERY